MCFAMIEAKGKRRWRLAALGTVLGAPGAHGERHAANRQ